jgi:hypothetical protein
MEPTKTKIEARKIIVVLLALKRRRIHSMGHLDRFLMRVLAKHVWSMRNLNYIDLVVDQCVRSMNMLVRLVRTFLQKESKLKGL